MTKKDFLTTIVAQKKAEVAEAKSSVALSALQKDAEARTDHRSFFAALADTARTNVIAEIKRASPSKGDLNLNLNPAELAKEYEQGGAAALSVLTETAFFRGSVEDLRRARAACGLPVLRKDFTIDPYQIVESAALGADAVLLIARLLSKSELDDFVALAQQFSLEPLVEIHSAADAEKLPGCGARLIGINNRNLQTFETDLEIAKEMVAMVSSEQIPIAASGIATRDDVLLYETLGIHAFLVGESLVKSGNSTLMLKQLRGEN